MDLSATPSGGAAILSDTEGGVWRFDPARPTPSTRVAERPGVVHVAGSDAGVMALGVGERVELLDPDGAPLRTLQHGESRVQEVTFSPSGRLLAVGHRDGLVRVWRVEDGALLAILDGHSARVPAARFSADGGTLYTASWDAQVLRWDTWAFEAPAEDLRDRARERWNLRPEVALQARAGGR